jgi:hypothetical protein
MTTTPSTGGPADSVVQDFADMSAALTGFQSSFLRPFLDPTNLSEVFYNFAVAQTTQLMMDNLLAAFRTLKAQTNPALTAQQIADALLEVAKPAASNQAQLCQSIIGMWYLGSWYIPAFQASNGKPGGTLQVVSSQAYTKSLVWNIAQAHPMGFSAFVFGYWSQPPASLDTFGVNTGGGQ